ncbi:Atp-dependent RNA helicase, partial [Globisporangium splendens]
MGVRGLTTYCAQNEASTSTKCDALQDVTLAVDFVGFLFHVCDLVYKQVQKESEGSSNSLSPQAWLLLGGCPERLEVYTEQWLKTLRAAKISLVFVTDPPQCFGGKDHRKAYCLQDRALQKVARIQLLADTLFESTAVTTKTVVTQEEVLTSSVPADRDDGTIALRIADGNRELTAKLLQQANGIFPFAREKLRAILKKHGMTIKTAKREADEELADLVRTQGAFAILGHDSDFFCMRGTRYIPFSKLVANEESGVVSARVFSPDLVAASLGLRVDQLVDLALLCSNDLTPLLDAEYGMAHKLNFPIQRTTNCGSNSSLFPKDAAKWIVHQLPVLDNPVLAQIEAETPGFLRSLYEIYRFYGHSAAFLKQFPIQIEPSLPKSKLNAYRKLLDRYEFPPSAIDVLEMSARSISNRFDPLLVKGRALAGLLAEVRQLAYHALNVLQVREVEAGDQFDRVVKLQRLDFLKSLHAVPHQGRSAKMVDCALRGLTFSLLYGQNGQSFQKASSLSGALGKARKQALDVKTIVYSLLLLKKCDDIYLHDCRLLSDQRIELLLLTSLLCVNRKPAKLNKSSRLVPLEVNEQAIEWEVYAAVTAFLETLKQISQLRLILGEKPLPTAGCTTFFSPEVFIRVSHGLADDVKTAWNSNSSSGVSRAQVETVFQQLESELTVSIEEFWNEFTRLRAATNQMENLIPAPKINVQQTSKSVNATDALAKKLVKLKISEQEGTTVTTGGTTSAVVQSRSNLSQVAKKSQVYRPVQQDANPPVPPPVPRSVPPKPPLPLPFPPSIANSSDKALVTSEKSKPAKKAAAKALKGLTPSIVAKRLGSKAQTKSRNGSENGRASEESSKSKKNGSGSTGVSIEKAIDAATGSDSGVVTSASTSSGPDKIQGLQGLMETLPVFQHRHEILNNVAHNQITIIQGETGCGKSTSVPQFLLDDALRGPPTERPVGIYVTQPRRIAAIELANTVAGMRKDNEFGEDGVVGNVIGYRIGQKQLISNRTKITYVTTGYMVERLIHDPESLQKITHLVLDEVHERSMDVDLLLLLLKLQLSQHSHLRLVIMSATMDAKVILNYFANSLSTRLVKKKPLFVGSKLFPVENVFLDGLDSRFPQLYDRCRKEFIFMQNKFKTLVDNHTPANHEAAVLTVASILEKQLQVILEMVKMLIESGRHQQKSQCILVFLPGISSINAMYESLSELQNSSSGLVRVFVLHSGLELEHQQEAFRTIDQKSTKVILSTNIAESSVTIPDVTHVINCGIEKQIEMPNAGSTHAEVLINTWCSQASAKQRAGRAGRVMAGTAFHMFSQSFYEACMLEYSTPEMLRKPLDRIILLLKGKMDQFGTPSVLLQKALNAPNLQNVEGAYKLLAHFDAIDSTNEKTAKMTTFGSFVCHFPLSLQLCRLVMTGAYLMQESPEQQAGVQQTGTGESWSLLLHVVILVSVLSVPDLFLSPSFYHAHSAIGYIKEMNQNLKAKLDADAGVWSEPLAIWRLYLELMARHSPTKKLNLGHICRQRSISFRRFQTLNFLISDLCNRLIALAKNPTSSFSGLLSTKTVEMLTRLDGYASSQRVDKRLLQFSKRTLEGTNLEEEVLRFLIVHNYDEHLIGGAMSNPANFGDDDDLDRMDRIDLKISNESFKEFSAMKNKQRVEMFDHLASSSADTLKEFAAIAYDGKIVSLYTHATSVANDGNQDGDEERRNYHDLLPRMSFPVSLLYYIRDQRFPVDFGVHTDNRELKLRFRVDSSNGSTLSWCQQKDNGKVSLSGRNLFSLPVRDVEDKLPSQKLLAVYAERLFTGDESRMFCSKCTLLPPDSVGYYPTMLLVCARARATIWLLVNEEVGEISTVKVDAQVVVMPKETALHLSVLDTVNVVRQGFSDAHHGVVQGKRLNATHLLALADDRNFVVRATPTKRSAGRSEWRQLRPRDYDAATLKEMEVNGIARPRFPPLVMS